MRHWITQSSCFPILHSRMAGHLGLL